MSKRYFKLSITEQEEGTGVIVSAAADQGFILRNLVGSMAEHPILRELFYECVDTMRKLEELASEAGISPKEYIDREIESVVNSKKEESSKENTEIPSEEDEKIEAKNQELLNTIKDILNGKN